MKNRKRKFLQAGIVMMTLLLGSVVSHGECVHYMNGEPILENYIYFDADHVPLHFEYDIMEENAKILAPGIKETKTIAFENDEMQHVDYTCEIDLSNGTNQVLLGYEPGRLTSVSEQISSVETKTGKNVVAAVNGCFFEMEDARPNGLLISDGKVLNEARVPMAADSNIHMYENIFVITNEGEAKILSTRDLCYDKETDSYTPIRDGQFRFAISGNALVLRPNQETGQPEVVYFGYEPDARSQKHARSAVGIKDDGTVVLFSTSGKMSPFNHGYTCTELGRIMRAKGCHTAMLLDGGGSSTYVSQYPGEKADQCRTLSSEGTQREVCSGILIATTASGDGYFDAEEAETLQQGLTICEKNGHVNLSDGTSVWCNVCGAVKNQNAFTGLALEEASGRMQFLVDGKPRTGFAAYDMLEMQYFDEDGYACQVDLKSAEMPSCTAKGGLEFVSGQESFSFAFPKAAGHDYVKKKGKQVCRNCGWQAVDLETCQITIGNVGYSGKAKYPSISVVTPEGVKLQRKGDGLTGDFQRTISDNVEIGMAEVTFSPIVYFVNKMELRSSVYGERTVKFPILPYPAKNLQATEIGFDTVTLNWEPSASAGGDYEITYDVYVKRDGVWTKTASTTETSCQITELKKATDYTFGVCATAVGHDGKTYESWNKAQKKVTTNGLKAPSGLKASNVAASGKVKLTWNKVKGADAYCVYRAASKNGKYTLMKTVTKTSYTNTSSKAGKLYYYRVTAISRSDKLLNSEVSKTVSRRCDLQRPVINVSNDRKSGKPKLTWKKVQGAETYKVYRAAKKDGNYVYLGKTSKTAYVNKNAKKGKNYWYKVKAVDAKYSSAASAMSTPKRGKYPL